MVADKKNEKVSPTTTAIMRPIGQGEMPADVAGWEEEQISYPPYWNPSPDDPNDPNDLKYLAECAQGRGRFFKGLVVMLDDKDPNFVRYVVQASNPIVCKQGAKDAQEEVVIQEGEFFTLSAYAGLPLDRYFGHEVFVQVTGQRKVKQPQPMWEFRLLVSPESKKLLQEERKERGMLAAQAYRQSKQLQGRLAPALPAKGASARA